MTALDLDAVASNAVRRRRFCERCDDPASAECVAGGECEATRCGAHQPAEEWGHIHCWVPLDDGAEDVLRLVAEVRRLRSALADARREGAEAMREACIEAVEFGMPINNHEAAPVREALAAIRALLLPEVTP